MKIKLTSGFTGVISTGSYENTRPDFRAEIEYEAEDKSGIGDALDELQELCRDRFKAVEAKLIAERIQKEREDIRFYGSYPSVTSIINWDADFFVSPVDLAQYAAQGNLIDAQAKHFILTGEWKHASEVEGTWGDIVVCKKGSLHLPVEGWDFPAFLEKHPLEDMKVGGPVISHEHKFGGTPDIRVCYYGGLKTLADIKRTPDKLKHFKQTAAYIMAEEEMGESPYEQMMLIPLNDKTQQGWSKPMVSTEIDQFKKAFLKDRETFKRRFGV